MVQSNMGSLRVGIITPGRGSQPTRTRHPVSCCGGRWVLSRALSSSQGNQKPRVGTSFEPFGTVLAGEDLSGDASKHRIIQGDAAAGEKHAVLLREALANRDQSDVFVSGDSHLRERIGRVGERHYTGSSVTARSS